MDKNLGKYILLPMLGLGLLSGAGLASAHGMQGDQGGTIWRTPMTAEQRAIHQEEEQSEHAEILGISVEELKAARAEGKTLLEIAREKGLNVSDVQKKLIEHRNEERKEHLAELVKNGTLTQEESDQMLARAAGHRGSGMGMRFGHHF